MNNTRANYEVFKESFLKTTKDYSFYDEIRENSSECAWIKEDRDFVKSTMKGDLAKTLWLSYNNNNDSHDEINMYYSSLLDKTKRLALELGLTNSLEISNLCSFKYAIALLASPTPGKITRSALRMISVLSVIIAS